MWKSIPMGFRAEPLLDQAQLAVGSHSGVTGNTTNTEICFLPFGVMRGMKGARGDSQPGAPLLSVLWGWGFTAGQLSHGQHLWCFHHMLWSDPHEELLGPNKAKQSPASVPAMRRGECCCHWNNVCKKTANELWVSSFDPLGVADHFCGSQPGITPCLLRKKNTSSFFSEHVQIPTFHITAS